MVDVLTWVMQRRLVLADRAERLRKELADLDVEVSRLEAEEVVFGQFADAQRAGQADDPAMAGEFERGTTAPGAGWDAAGPAPRGRDGHQRAACGLPSDHEDRGRGGPGRLASLSAPQPRLGGNRDPRQQGRAPEPLPLALDARQPGVAHRHRNRSRPARCWLQLLACTGDMAKATPKALHYRFLHVPAVIVHGQHRRRLKIPASWPWAEQIGTAFRRLWALPHPT
ncbi:hypothetical protein ABID95_001306 [Streptomyces atratus]|uniref:hypothetical protein n=1 Tax=Streptomyces atratus TaxID=1893 RepID=UPI0033930FC5